MIADKKEFSKGFIMMVGFVVLLVLIFMPLFNGKNGLEYADALYNSISKYSAYYIPAVTEEVETAALKDVRMTLDVGSTRAEQTALLFRAAGASATVSEGTVEVQGNLDAILSEAVKDADALFKNDGELLQSKYGYPGDEVLYNWWLAGNVMNKNLKKQKLFKEAEIVDHVKKKAVEPAYNYYGIEPQKLTDRLGIVLFSLVFYVVYTVWYGFGIMFLLEGWGMRLEH